MAEKMRLLAGVLAAALCFALTPVAVLAESETEDQTLTGFYVQALIPENQMDTSLSYFDLAVQPGLVQTLQVAVVNVSDDAISVHTKAVTASTNRNGIIDYLTPGVTDPTMQIVFSDIVEVDTPVVELAPGEEAVVTATLRMPSTPHEGVVLGGLVFTRADGEGEGAPGSADAGVRIRNVFNYVIGVKLNGGPAPAPDFELAEVALDAVNYQPAIVYSLHNPLPGIVKGMQVEADLYYTGSTTPVFQALQSDIDMAPNSVLPFSVILEDKLPPGQYHGNIRLQYEGAEWAFAVELHIAADEAKAMTQTALLQSAGAIQKTFDPLPVVMGAVGGALTAVVLTLIVLSTKKKKRAASHSRAARSKREKK